MSEDFEAKINDREKSDQFDRILNETHEIQLREISVFWPIEWMLIGIFIVQSHQQNTTIFNCFRSISR